MTNMDMVHQKKARLDEYLKNLGSIAIAFSSGVDSTFLLKEAHDLLGDKAIAVTARTASVPARELREADAFCRQEGIRQIIVTADVLSVEGFKDNPPDRCYICKYALFSKMLDTAKELGFPYLAEGSNMDDMGDYRPGMAAIAQLGIQSPLREAALTKEEIRILSKELDLPTWDKPSFACLATRFVYGETITEEKLAMVEKAEQKLMDLGFRQVRVRVHGKIARIEIAPADFGKITEPEISASINRYFQELGFLYVTLDLGGYVMGNMNKGIH